MVSSRNVEVNAKINVDTTELEAAEKKRDEIAVKEIELRRKVEQTAQRIAGIARNFIGLMRNIITLTGNALDAVANASIIVIEQIIGLAVSWFALQAAIASVPVFGQIVAGFSLGLAALALGVAIGQGVVVASGRDAATAQTNAALGALGNLAGIARGFEG